MLELSIIDKMVAEKWTMFAPSNSRGIARDYPELLTYKEFKNMGEQDLLFVWYMRCESSPYREYSDGEKLESCVRAAYKDKRVQHNKLNEFKDLVFDEGMQNAMARMELFRIGPRIIEKLLCDKIQENMRKLLDIDAETELADPLGRLDPAKAKSYVDMCDKAVDLMEKLTAKSEAGSFGIKKEAESDLKFGEALSVFHKQNRTN